MPGYVYIHMQCYLLATNVADLDGLPSISQRVDFIKDDAVILVALGHICACSQVYVLPKLLKNDLATHKCSVNI